MIPRFGTPCRQVPQEILREHREFSAEIQSVTKRIGNRSLKTVVRKFSWLAVMVMGSSPAVVVGQLVLSLEPTRVIFKKGLLQITLTNHGTEPVRGFCMVSRTVPAIIQEFLPPGATGILPGSSFETMLNTALENDSSQADVDGEVRSFALTCVAFEGGREEGLPEHLAMLHQIRAGRVLQLKRLLPILKRIQETTDENWLSAIRDSVASIKKIDMTLDDGTPAQGLVANGIRNTDNIVNDDLSELEEITSRSGIRAGREYLNTTMSNYRELAGHLGHPQRN